MERKAMRLKLYLDTSILGALADPGPEDRLGVTRRFLADLSAGHWEGYVSTLVLEEVERAPRAARETISRELRKGYLLVLEESPESLRLAQLYVSADAIPERYQDDARHVAMAAANDIAVIVSWNFRHMVNVARKRQINSVNLREGYPLLDFGFSVGDQP
jgi:predicted nucleic acid-binding protein